MPGEKPPVSKRRKIFLWIALGIGIPIFALGLASEFIEIEDETESSAQSTVPEPVTASVPTPKPTRWVVTATTNEERRIRAQWTVTAANDAIRRADQRATATARNSSSAKQSASSVSYSVKSNQNAVGRKQISLNSGRYTLSKTSGCIGAELARYPSDDLVESLIGASSISVSVSSGSYMLRAIGNGCIATLRN